MTLNHVVEEIASPLRCMFLSYTMIEKFTRRILQI